jgi:hypothetical protein
LPGYAELDEGPAGEALSFVALGAQVCEGQVDSFDFAEPVLVLGVLAACE